MEIFLVSITALLSCGFLFAVNAKVISAKRAAAIFFLTVWLIVWIASLFFLPWAYAQPDIYFKEQAEYARAIAEQADSIFRSSVTKDILNLIGFVLKGLPLTFLSLLGLFLVLLDSYALLILAAVGVFGTLLMLVGLMYPNSRIVSLALIAINSVLIAMLISTLPSIDQIGTLNNSWANLLVGLLGVTYGSGFVFALLISVAFNALQAWWLSEQLAGAKHKPPTPNAPTLPSRFSLGTTKTTSPTKRADLSRPSIRPPVAIAMLCVGAILLISALFLPLISYSPAACQGSIEALNGVLGELQRLTAELPENIRERLAFMPSSASDPRELFSAANHKALVNTLCTEAIWTHSLWFLQSGGGAWQFALLLTLLLGGLLIFVGLTRTAAAPLALGMTGLTFVTLLTLTHALATIETFGYHDDLSLRVIAVLGATQPSYGVLMPLLITAIVLPIVLPFYLRQSAVL